MLKILENFEENKQISEFFEFSILSEIGRHVHIPKNLKSRLELNIHFQKNWKYFKIFNFKSICPISTPNYIQNHDVSFFFLCSF